MVDVAVVPGSYVNQQRIDLGLQKASAALSPDVVRIRYTLGEDWSGEDAVFFRVVLKDSASERSQLRTVARRVEETVVREVQPRGMGLEAYFNFRSESEQTKLREEAWA